jgi:hypothetical protein
VKRVNPLWILFWLTLASPMLAFCGRTQEPATDWPKEVERACTAQRYGLRLAAARKVAQGGAAAVPAVRAFAQQRGKDEVPAPLVEAIVEHGGNDDAVVDLLRYWRAQALRGIALRAPALPARRAELAGLCAAHRDDPAWLTRTHARLGLALLGDAEVALAAEVDPRARTRLTALLLQHGQLPPLQPLFDALVDERTFLGVPWGQHTARDAHQALKAWLGDAHPLAAGGSFADEAAGIAALLPIARTKSGQNLQPPTPRRDVEGAPTDGFELLSCRHGDLFVQWTAEGEVRAGIDGATAVTLPAAGWQALLKDRTAIELPQNLGVVVCDSMRLRLDGPGVHVKVAPRALPAPAHDWLKRLATMLEEAGQPRLAQALHTGLSQFAAP